MKRHSAVATMNDQLRDELLLSMVSGIGPRMRQLLLERFGAAGAILDAPIGQLTEVQGIGPKTAANIRDARQALDPDHEMDLCRENNIDIIAIDDPRYPRSLREIPDPPSILFVDGTFEPHDALSIAIVGSRHCTEYGRRHAKRLAGELCRAGLVVISGMARGIDSAAHQGAIEAGGRTIAVLGSGVLEIYPPENKGLAKQIAEQGAVVSESPPLMKPQGHQFPQRNRIISGMTLGTIIIEASERSGALITARQAYEQGREVFALPGPVDRRTSKGCHQLIRDGAALIETADDIIEALGPLVEGFTDDRGQKVNHPAELQLNEVERKILDAIQQESTLIDSIISETGFPAHQVMATLSVLEIRRLIRKTGGTSVLRL